MKKALLASAALAALGVASAAQAAIVAQFTNLGSPTNGTVTASGYTAYIINLVSDQGVITGVDAQSAGNGITGPLVQRWSSGDVDGNYNNKSITGTAVNTGTSSSNFDSHLLTPGGQSSNYVGTIGFDESIGSATFPPSGSAQPGFPANSDAAGIVTSINGSIVGAFGLDPSVQTATFPLAYVVAPTGTTNFGNALVVTLGAGTAVSVPLVIVPEPATLGLAGIAGLGMLARRRRA